jgi:hypothetical protein
MSFRKREAFAVVKVETAALEDEIYPVESLLERPEEFLTVKAVFPGKAQADEEAERLTGSLASDEVLYLVLPTLYFLD